MEIANPAALSPAELIFLPVESCSIAVPRALSFLIRLACARDAPMLVLTTAMIGLLLTVCGKYCGLTFFRPFVSLFADNRGIGIEKMNFRVRGSFF